MNNPTLSAYMANYNHAQYVGEALESIVSQSFRPMELIMVDDASTDNSVEIIEKFVRKYSFVHLIRNKKNIGSFLSTILALNSTSGEYVIGLASDDKFLPNLFEKQMNILTQYPKAGMCCTDTRTIWEHSGVVIENKRGFSNVPCYISPEEMVKIMKKKIVYISGFAAMIKRSVLIEIGTNRELKWSSDRFYALVIALRYGFCYVPEPLALYRQQLESYGTSGLKDKNGNKKVIENILELLKKPQYNDVLSKFKRSCALASLGMSMFRVLILSPKHWDYLSFNLARLILWDELKNTISPYIPFIIKKTYRLLIKNI
ncbi:glycosyltransferase [bacterium]|nr:glycosyltransferase [bacterium]MBU3956395.1 glycosyltransferase [bacterium]